MKITFLGTGTSQGIPVIGCDCEVCKSTDFRNHRLRSSILIQTKTSSVVIDTGPDFRQQMLSNRVQSLDAVLFTHEHKDHVAGLDDIRSFNFKQKKDMPVYASDRVIDRLKEEFPYIFQTEKYPGVPSLDIREIRNEPFEFNDLNFQPIEVLHYKLPIFGYRIRDFAYLTDVKTIDEKEKEKLQGLKVLVLNALQLKPHISHLTLDEALELIAELSPQKTYLTHISHYLGIHKEVEKNLPDNVFLAYDGLSIKV